MNTITQDVLHKEIDLIQACIARISNNSFLIKGWTLSIVAIALALHEKDSDIAVVSVILLFIIFNPTDAQLYGGRIGTKGGDAFIGNTPNLHTAIEVGSVENFQTLNFHLPATMTPGGTPEAYVRYIMKQQKLNPDGLIDLSKPAAAQKKRRRNSATPIAKASIRKSVSHRKVVTA